jgi:hypothetical protein
MEQVNTNLKSLTEFRDYLMRFNQTLADEFTSMRWHLQNLGDAWDDAKYDEFSQTLQEAARGIDHYLQAAPDYEASLAQFIKAVEAFLGIHTEPW